MRNIKRNEKIRKFGVDNPDRYWLHRKDEKRLSERRLHKFLSNLVEEMVPNKDGKILDCGMGAGHVFRSCQTKYETYGVEISNEAIALYDFPIDNVRQADLNNGIPDFGVKFDVIIASMILHWLSDPYDFLKQARSLLSRGGKLVVVIPNITYYRFRITYLFGRFPPISLSHKNLQVPAEAEQMFKQVGFKIKRRISPKKSIKTKLWPTLFATDIVYVLEPM